MFSPLISRSIAVVSLSALAAVGVAGCSSLPDVPGDYPDITLAETKSPAQLMRNEAGERLPEEVIGNLDESEDISVACLSEEKDPTGRVRSWHSTVDIRIADDYIESVEEIADTLVASFVDEGWSSKDSEYYVSMPDDTIIGSAKVIGHLLSLETNPTRIQVSVVETALNADFSEVETSIEIQAQGPCVLTAGVDSDEVKRLEGRS